MPDNTIRPAVLNSNTPLPASNSQLSPELSNTIRSIVSQVLLAEALTLIQSIVNPAREIVTDQIIEPRHANNLAGLDRVPDVVRCLRDFSGDPREYTTTRKALLVILASLMSYAIK